VIVINVIPHKYYHIYNIRHDESNAYQNRFFKFELSDFFIQEEEEDSISFSEDPLKYYISSNEEISEQFEISDFEDIWTSRREGVK
jgi:hypothetical protein